MKVYLAMDTYPDPEGGSEFRNRVTMQDVSFTEFDFPPGKRARFFDLREADVPETTYAALLAGGLSPEEQDTFHREAWDQAAETDDEKWSR